MSRFWSPSIRDLTPYTPGEQPGVSDLVKLNTNELPFGPSPLALAAMREAVTDDLRLYPDPGSSVLRQELAAYHDVEPGQVFVGNGSDEILAFAFAALLRQEARLLFPDVTYSFYATYCRLFNIASEQVSLRENFDLRVDDYARPAGAIIFANPNAPTGIALPVAEVERLLRMRPDVPVVIDEAYVDFGGESALPLVAAFPNLLVVRTMSKSRALAGLRVGYAIGDRSLIEGLERVKDSFNSYPLDRLAQAGAVASLKDEGYFRGCIERVLAARQLVVSGLQALGFEVLPSSANFVFGRHPAHDGASLVRELRQRGVLVRHFTGPRIADYLRITIGGPQANERLLAVLHQIVGH